MTDQLNKPVLIKGADNVKRCWWCGEDDEYVRYHDAEWGQPIQNDTRLFEKICLEGFQAGLSWLTILRKREAFREVFLDFDFVKVAKFKPKDVTRLLKDARIVRHRGKIESVINNSKKAMELQQEFGSLADFFWQFEPRTSPVIKEMSDCAAMTDESKSMSKALKKRGWSFVGPTTCYAFMQSMGIVNDHVQGCKFRSVSKKARKALDR